MNLLVNVKRYGMLSLLLGAGLLASCDTEAPGPENNPEVFTDVKLIFTNVADASKVVTARAEDPDGEGVRNLEILDEITLTSGVTYTLTYEILNDLNAANIEDLGKEILEEDHEHQFFFSFTNDAFSNPLGNGNFDKADDPLNYKDKDENGHAVGLKTEWTAGDALSDGEFRVRLQHQPDVKTGTTGVNDGDTDFDLTFVLNIQ